MENSLWSHHRWSEVPLRTCSVRFPADSPSYPPRPSTRWRWRKCSGACRRRNVSTRRSSEVCSEGNFHFTLFPVNTNSCEFVNMFFINDWIPQFVYTSGKCACCEINAKCVCSRAHTCGDQFELLNNLFALFVISSHFQDIFLPTFHFPITNTMVHFGDRFNL